MDQIQNKLISVIKKQGVDFVHFVDVSSFKYEQSKGYSTAILLGIVLSKEYIKRSEEDKDGLIKEIQNHVKKVTAPYKYPRVVEFVDELPKTISGKIKRISIRSKK